MGAVGSVAGRVTEGPLLDDETGETTFVLALEARVIEAGPPAHVVDGEAEWCEVTCAADLAQNVADSLVVGDRVFAAGEFIASVVGGVEGSVHVLMRLRATTVGQDLRYGVARLVARPAPPRG